MRYFKNMELIMKYKVCAYNKMKGAYTNYLNSFATYTEAKEFQEWYEERYSTTTKVIEL